jgi:DNA-binding CsgD family transcriptional regulator
MRRLSASDAVALLELVAELHDLDDPLPFPPRLLASLRQLIPCDSVGYYDVDTFARRSLVNVWHEDGDEGVVVGDEDWWKDPGERELYWSVRDTHPVCAYRYATGDWTTPCKVSDFVSLREFRRTPFYDAFIQGCADYLLQMGLAVTPTRERGFGLWRLAPDFDERDRLVLSLLHPHLAARAQAVATAIEAADALAELEDGKHNAQLVVLCSQGGVIEYASPTSRALLARYLGIANGSLPAAALARPELRLTHKDGRLHMRIARTGGLYVLLLDERKRRLEKLTAREREILDRVAHGMQNDLIARELEIAPATVAKHLEHAYRKLAVTNRTAAAAAMRE